MTRYMPGSQTKELMQEKRTIAERLLRKGLTVEQVSQQLRCSRAFVMRIWRRINEV